MLAFPLRGEVHLWWVRLDLPSDQASAYFDALDEEEAVRARGFKFQEHRTRYLVSHGALRTILGRYLGLAAKDVCFQLGERGKPELSPETPVQLFFNLTHSHERALVGVSPDGELGVDLEQIRPMDSLWKLAEGVFGPEEMKFLGEAEEPEKAFFLLWTRKEAVLKASGEGLTRQLQGFSVLPKFSEPCRFEGVATLERHWSVATLRPRPGWVGAVAIAGEGARIDQFEFA